MKFSLEITSKTDLSVLPGLQDVYVTMLPGTNYKEVAKKADDLIKSGYNPIPHFPARSIKDLNELKDYVKMCKDSGVKQALVIGGGREPIGEYHCSLQLLETGLFQGMKIGIAGHPDGSPDIFDLFKTSFIGLIFAALAISISDFILFIKSFISGGLGKNRTYDTYLFRVLLYY